MNCLLLSLKYISSKIYISSKYINKFKNIYKVIIIFEATKIKR